MNPATATARAVVDALVAAGVREVLLCPGSRSAPLAYALHAADAAGDVRLHVRHDERSAAFTALGVGRQTGVPAAVVTTSGTAVANLLPAVLEASSAGVPLLVLSADRPARLLGTWANQSTPLQPGLLGAAVRCAGSLEAGSVDPAGGASGVAEGTEVTERAKVTEGVAEAVGVARGGAGARPGPVHLDVGFDDPLVPDPPPRADQALQRRSRNPSSIKDLVHTATPRGEDNPPAVELAPGPRTAVVAGDGAGDEARVLAEAAGWPLLAEPSSGARHGPHAVGPYRLLLDRPHLGGRIERAVVLGRPTLSRPVTRLLDRPDVEVVQVVRSPDDPGPARPVRRVGAVLPPGPDDASRVWLATWRTAGAAAARALGAVLADALAETGLTGPLLAREVAAASRAGDRLVLAASNPVRDADLTAAPWPGGRPPAVHANRGLSGIDGTMSTAAGVALAGGATRALVGDVAFLHDLNGLLLGPGEPVPDLQVVVLDDDGGGIFGLLEHGEPERAATFERLFGTPHGADLPGLCAALGVGCRTVEDLDDLRSALATPPPGRSVLHVPADRRRLRDLHARIRARVDAATPAT